MTKSCRWGRTRAWKMPLAFLLGLALSAGIYVPQSIAQQPARARQENLAPAEFARLIAQLSEDDGYFRSDNLVSNETGYLSIVDKLRELRVSGGAYIGVGPEQNFTYIAKIRPRIAFIVDIRRQAALQHLLYKALFHISSNRTQFLAHLLSRPVAAENPPDEDASIERLVEYFSTAPVSEEAYKADLARLQKMIEEQFKVSLSALDRQRIENVYGAFRMAGLDISFRTSPPGWPGGYGYFPSMKELMIQRDLNGNPGHFLASEEDYRFLRELQMQNRIIPVTGNFAGDKAIAAVADYLRTHGYTVRAFYTSNVEQFLFQSSVFNAFADNVRKLPIDDTSVIIRAYPSRGQQHPAAVAGHRITTILQKISLFVKGYEAGVFASYWDLVTTDYIGAK